VPLYTGVDLSGWKIDAKEKPLWKSSDWRLVHDSKTATTDSVIWSEETFGDFELILDARLPKDAKDARAAVLIGGADPSKSARIKIAGAAGAEPGEWCRYRVTLQDGRMSVAVDDKVVTDNQPVADLVSPAAIGLACRGGPIQLANLLIRRLPPDQ
jgi:hypothetical protein